MRALQIHYLRFKCLLKFLPANFAFYLLPQRLRWLEVKRKGQEWFEIRPGLLLPPFSFSLSLLSNERGSYSYLVSLSALLS
jgi:hypothetical protein